MTKNSSSIVKENKAFPLQIKEFDDAQGRIKGYLSTFDNVDEGKDRVRPGAFKRTLANKYAYKQKHNKRYVMPFLWQHDTNEPVGGFLELKEDTVGLWFDLEIDLDIQRGRECYSGYKKGYIYQTSMGYDCLQSEYVKVDGEMVRDLLEVRLWEGSAVTFPMNEQAVVTDVKSAEKDKLMDEKDKPAKPKQQKTLMEHYNEEMAEDLLEDWQDVYVCSLTGAIFDAFTIGDQPAQDISEALDAFKELVLSKFVAQAVECGLSQYLSDNDYGYNPGERTIHNGSDDGPGSYYGYMSRRGGLARKAGRAISASNQSSIDNHVSSLHDIANKMLTDMKAHSKAVHTAADDFANAMQGAEQPYDGDDPGNPDEGQQEGKQLTLALAELKTLRAR